MPPVPQVAQQISQEQSQQQNGPNLSSFHSSLPAPHGRKPASLQQLILSVARHHEDVVRHKEACRKREEKQLRAVAASTAREIEHFWSTIQQVNVKKRTKKCKDVPVCAEIRDPLNESLQEEESLPDLLTSTVKKSMADLAAAAAAAEALLPKGSAQITTAVKSDSPPLLRGTLRDYQKTGLEWLAKLYQTNLNGILADEAGLGKTVQVVAFFAHLACNEGNWGPILVVSQNFNVLKWEIELRRWCPALKILLYLGDPGELLTKRQEWTDPNTFNVCVASCEQFFKDSEAFMKVQWRYLVLDERQNGGNMTEQHWDAIFNLQSHHRLLLMDTILPTAFQDLWAIACFLIPGISQSYLFFTKVASVEGNEDHYQRVAARLQRVMQSFILRRSKIHVEKQLPRRYEHVLTCTFSHRQKSMYKDILSQPRTQEYLRSGHLASVLHILTQLLRVCNHPDLISSRLPSSSVVLDTLEFTTASLVLNALAWDLWKHADWSLFDVIGMENRMTRYEAQILPKLKVTRERIEEIYSSPSAPRLEPLKLKPNRLFTPVQYGQKPEGRTRDFSRSPLQKKVDTATDHCEKIKRRQPLVMFSENPCRKAASKILLSPTASAAGTQERGAQPEKPGIIEEKRQLKEHLDKIYSVNERHCSRTPLYGRDLLEICSWISERKISQHCSARINKWRWAGFANCLPYSSTSGVLKDPLQELILSLKQQQIALRDVVIRDLRVLPAVAVATPYLYVAHPPYTYTHKMRVLKLSLKEQILPYFHSLQQIARPHFLQFPDPRLLQRDSGKMEALAVLLRKLKARGHRVLILTQMIPMLDILELFLNVRFLTYVRVEESGACSWRFLVRGPLAQESIKNFNQDKRFFCAILSSHTPATGVSHVDADAVVFYDTDLDPLMEKQANEWCDKIARGRDVHIYRFISGNSVEERLLRKGIKHLIQEVAAEGDNRSTDVLTQVHDSRNAMAPSRLERLASFLDELKPIEKYALNFLELFHTLNEQKSQNVNEELKTANIKWDYQHAKELEKTKEKLQQKKELLTYTRQDAYNMEFVSEGPDGEIEIMPLWTPPIVPESHDDVYTDSVMCLMYTSTLIPESKLPPLVVRKACKRKRADLASSGERKKHCHRRMVVPPPSLFDEVTPRILKTRQKSKAQKTFLLQNTFTALPSPLSALIKAAADTGQDSPAWLIAEDLALLKAVKQLRTLPLNPALVSPAQRANWEFVSDVVNSCNYVHRSPKQCQNRYTNAFASLDGKNRDDYSLHARQAYANDQNSERIQIYMNHFELMTMTSRKRSSSKRFLADNYDKLLPMPEVVSICAEPMMIHEKESTKEQIAAQLQEQQPSQKQEEEPTDTGFWASSQSAFYDVEKGIPYIERNKCHFM
ncbi:PREDICTED: E1A-binding protein p400-like, partial [Eurypyga helias]